MCQRATAKVSSLLLPSSRPCRARTAAEPCRHRSRVPCCPTGRWERVKGAEVCAQPSAASARCPLSCVPSAVANLLLLPKQGNTFSRSSEPLTERADKCLASPVSWASRAPSYSHSPLRVHLCFLSPLLPAARGADLCCQTYLLCKFGLSEVCVALGEALQN